jgi:hypothetical protein
MTEDILTKLEPRIARFFVVNQSILTPIKNENQVINSLYEKFIIEINKRC